MTGAINGESVIVLVKGLIWGTFHERGSVRISDKRITVGYNLLGRVK